MRSDLDYFLKLFDPETYVDFAPTRDGTNTWHSKRQYVGKSLTTMSRANVMELLCWIDELSSYEVGRVLPALLYHALRQTDDQELQENLGKLNIHVEDGESRAEIKMALNDALDAERYDALALGLSDLIALHAYDDECAEVLVPLVRLKDILCGATAWVAHTEAPPNTAE